MEDKNKLKILQMLKDNPASMLKEGEEAMGRVAGVDFPKGADPTQSEKSILKRLKKSMKRPKGFKVPADELVSTSKTLGKRLGGKAAAVLGPLGLLLSEGADAADAGEPRSLEREMIENAIETQKKSRDPYGVEAMQDRGDARSDRIMNKDQDMDGFRKYISNINSEIMDMDAPEREIRAEVREAKPTREKARNAKRELAEMLLDKGMLK